MDDEIKNKINQLIHQLKNNDNDVKRKAIVEIKNLRVKEAVPILMDLLNSDSDGVRINALTALSEISGKEICDRIVQLLHDPVDVIRIEAIKALEFLKCDKYLDNIINVLLNDDDYLVRTNAAEILGCFKDKKALPSLIKALEDEHKFVRAYASFSIGLIGGKNEISILEKQLKIEKKTYTKAFILSSLVRLGENSAINRVFDLIYDVDDHEDARIALDFLIDEANENNKEMIKTGLKKIVKEKNDFSEFAEHLLKKLNTIDYSSNKK